MSRPRLKKSQYVRERARFCIYVSPMVRSSRDESRSSYSAEDAEAKLDVAPDCGPAVDPAEVRDGEAQGRGADAGEDCGAGRIVSRVAL